MTHLTAQQFVDAIEGVLSPAQARHINGCAACRQQIADLRSLAAEVAEVDAPEPSPLFWDHLSQRVRAATSVEAIPAPARWRGFWNPAMTVGLAAAVMAVVLVVRTGPPRPSPVPIGELALTGVSDEAMPASDESFTFVARVASTVDAEDLHQAAHPTADGVDAALGQLTDEQRATLVRLLKAKMGSGE